jgi:prophage antirepressor-like protein
MLKNKLQKGESYMMNDLKIFENKKFGKIRTTIKDGEPWFVLKDICESLEIGNSRMVSERLEYDEKGVSIIDTLGGKQEMSIVSESGLYKVIFQSRKENALKFQSWVTKEVIPQIRKTGSYSIAPKNLKEALYLAYKQQEEIEKLNETNECLEIALNTSIKFYTATQYNKKFKMNWNMKKYQKIGMQMTAYCSANRIEIRKCQTNDERFGETNSYPLPAWENFFDSKRREINECVI